MFEDFSFPFPSYLHRGVNAPYSCPRYQEKDFSLLMLSTCLDDGGKDGEESFKWSRGEITQYHDLQEHPTYHNCYTKPIMYGCTVVAVKILPSQKQLLSHFQHLFRFLAPSELMTSGAQRREEEEGDSPGDLSIFQIVFLFQLLPLCLICLSFTPPTCCQLSSLACLSCKVVAFCCCCSCICCLFGGLGRGILSLPVFSRQRGPLLSRLNDAATPNPVFPLYLRGKIKIFR